MQASNFSKHQYIDLLKDKWYIVYREQTITNKTGQGEG
ncbi:hypothetical protein B4086_5552 [Bacillus cereus]|nr:hypothetical protein B4086_5552 [Bacillus cereus]